MTTAVAVRQESRFAEPEAVQRALQREDRAQMLATLLAGSGIAPERFAAVVLNTMVRNPDLQKASLESVLDSIRVAATLRLEPTGILGEGYIIKYGDKAQFEAGYRGLMKLARRSGQVDAMDAQVVYINDAFAIQLGTDPRIDHQPSTAGERGGYRGAYAWARLATGELVTEWMTDADIQAVRKSSRAGTGPSSPWVAHYGEMARKTVIKRLMKRLPLGADAETALRHEAEVDQTPTDAPRRPTAAITAIHSRLGIPAAVEAPDAYSEHLPPEPPTTTAHPSQGAQETAEAPTGAVSAVPAVSPSLCDTPDPIDEEHCALDEGHDGWHADSDGRTWK